MLHYLYHCAQAVVPTFLPCIRLGLELNLAEVNTCLLLSLTWALDEGTVSHGCKCSLAGRGSTRLGSAGKQAAPELGPSSLLKAGSIFLVNALGRWKERTLASGLAPPAASLQRDRERLPGEDLNSALLLPPSNQAS